MATVASTAEMALDFSKTALEKREDVPPSPSPSLSNSDGESSRSASVSDGHQEEREASTVATVKPLKTPKMSPSGRGDKSPPQLSPGQENGSGEGDPSGMRPFKVYPFEHMPMFASNPLAAAAGSELYNAYAAATMPYGLAPGLLDSAMLSSPLNNYFNRRRRSNTSGNSTTNTTSSTAATTTNVSSSSSPVSTSPVLGTQLSVPSTSVTSNGALSSGDSDSECGSAKRAKLGAFPGEEKKDEAYWERRRKNNEAAKRSRDARRAKEEEIAMRAAFLEQENLKLRAQVAILKNETAKLHYMLYSRSCS
ncbi:protein giant [Lingula anatina]|uniref:Protein giant n=1 Tax=Lingula anatina TaxID=7574 RepID=A0A1S3HWM0_LINAN|nr:protein giant [Lingula anatina]|eukprot:XP_013390430.1 protein giant [Lingula anatina]